MNLYDNLFNTFKVSRLATSCFTCITTYRLIMNFELDIIPELCNTKT